MMVPAVEALAAMPFPPNAGLRPAPEPTQDQARAQIAATPDSADWWRVLGELLDRARHPDARNCLHRAVRLAPDHAAAWSALALAFTNASRHAEAIHASQRAIALEPSGPERLRSRVSTQLRTGSFDDALKLTNWLVRLDPTTSTHAWPRAQIRLHRGDYADGWEDYESRYDMREYVYRLHRGTRWSGQPLDGKVIMITVEQGFGDTLLMARYLPMLKQRGAKRVVVECQPELRRLFANLPGVDSWIERDQTPPPLYHYHSSIMSLPRCFETRIDRIPPPHPLTIPDEARAKAAALLGPRDGRLRVGFVWSGSPTFADNAIRAASLDRFLPMLDIPGLRLFSLQKGPMEGELTRLPAETPITPLGPEMSDFADTAAVIEQLDLVVMTDSSVAHLTGTLGVPVWVLLQRVPYWVFGMTGDRTPWYPSMRLHRQGADEDWGPVFDAMLRDLRALAANRVPA